jgi:hypothetical protein
MKHLKLFKTQAEYESATLKLPNVSYIVENDTVNFHPYVIDYSSQYLTFEAIEDSTFKLTEVRNGCYYSLDEGITWKYLSYGTNTPKVPAGSKIMFKIASENPTIKYTYGVGVFTSTGKFNVEGNVMSMLYGDNFIDKHDLNDKQYVFSGLFQRSNVVEAHNLILPATTLSKECYSSMFFNCKSLTTAPALPATTLVDYCYYSMFAYCSSLTKAPVLPATILADRCYYHMFGTCTGLTTAPELPATTLATDCYCNMFSGCTNLGNITMLATDISASDCLHNWVKGVSSTGTFTKHSDTTLPSGDSGIPSGWEVVNYQE